MRPIKVFLCAVCLVIAFDGNAADDKIEVVKAEGIVVTSDPYGKQERTVAAQNILPTKNIMTTGANGRAIVRVGDTGYIVIEKNSKIELGRKQDNARFFRQITGMIYYALNFIKEKQHPVEIRTCVATLGIRGTRFLVTNLADRNEIGMRKGLLSVASPDDGEFEIRRKTEQEEFDAFKQESAEAVAKEKQEFEEFKTKTEREFVEYKHEFSLGANRMASFDGKRVIDRPLSAESNLEIETVETYAGEWLKQVHD
ncbi:MAG: FecR domain-containing protein [Sideroxydans sp.]|nr:FecR domain-containing protein [Sideroxydans sp.]